MTAVVVVGAGWIGRAVATSAGVTAVARRAFTGEDWPRGSSVVVASGRSVIAGSEGLAVPLHDELAHLRLVLDVAERNKARRIVVIGSCDVAGMAPVIDGTTPQDPRTTYAEVKAALEDECVLRHDRGAAVTYLRMAPVHGPGKQRTSALVALSRLPVVPLPNGGNHSTGFLLLADAVRAVCYLLSHSAPAVQSAGSGNTPLRQLLQCLAEEQGRVFRGMAVPVPGRTVARLWGAGGPDRLQWAIRLACARSVLMEPRVTPTPLRKASQMLVQTC